jgi:uncharacterized protein (DUF2252 family)
MHLAMRDALAEFMEFNRPFAKRSPELLRFKVARMAETPFAFFRGTFHLFARDVIDHVCGPVPWSSSDGSELDIVGDIHSENYGTYKATDGLIHYDINDFDETTQGRFDFDVSRLGTSLFLASRAHGDSLKEATFVSLACAAIYAQTVRKLLKKGKDSHLDVSESSRCDCGAVNDLVETAAARKRPDFIAGLTEMVDGHRRLRRSAHYFTLPDSEREQAVRLLDDYRRRMPPPTAPDFYELSDVCGRVSGIGSMGRFRYVALVAGKGKKEGRNVLLEFKESRPSAYDLYRQRQTDAQALARRAERVVTVQRESQAASSPYLGLALDGGLSFQVREIGPQDARLDANGLKGGAVMESVAGVQASILARTHARAAARAVGPTNPLAELEDTERFCQRMLAFALAYADVVQRDWVRFVGQRADLEDVAKWA